MFDGKNIFKWIDMFYNYCILFLENYLLRFVFLFVVSLLMIFFLCFLNCECSMVVEVIYLRVKFLENFCWNFEVRRLI